MPSPAFAVLRRGQQSVGQLLNGGVTILLGSGFKFRNLSRCWWQSGEVESEAADESERVGLRGRVQIVFELFGADEMVDGIARPFFSGGGGFVQWRSLQRFERPMFLPLRTLSDPLPESCDLRGGKFFAALGRRHSFFEVNVGNAFEQFLQNRPGGLFSVKPQLGLASAAIGSVAGIAVRREDGPHIVIIRDCRRQRHSQARHHQHPKSPRELHRCEDNSSS